MAKGFPKPGIGVRFPESGKPLPDHLVAGVGVWHGKKFTDLGKPGQGRKGLVNLIMGADAGNGFGMEGEKDIPLTESEACGGDDVIHACRVQADGVFNPGRTDPGDLILPCTGRDQPVSRLSCCRKDIMLGSTEKKPSEAEMEIALVARKSIVARRAIRAGEPFDTGNLTVKRPGNGLSPMLWDMIINTVAHRDYQPDEMIEREGNDDE